MRDADRNKHSRPTIGGHGFGNKKDDNKKDVCVSKCINIEFTNGIDIIGFKFALLKSAR